MFYYHKILLTTALFLSLTPTVTLANTSCSVDLSGGMKMDVNHIEFFQDGDDKEAEQKSLYKIVEVAQGNTLVINNQKITLKDTQQELLTEYDKNLRQLVPQVKVVAMESVDLAIEGIDLAFNDLLGENNQLAKNLTQELQLVKAKIIANLSIEKGISVGVNGVESSGIFAKDIEQRVKVAIENAVVNSMGAVFMAIGQQVMLANSNEPSFDVRMKNFSDKVEQEFTVKTEKIKEKSQVLCASLSKIDSLEEQLKSEVKQLSNINVFTVSQSSK